MNLLRNNSIIVVPAIGALARETWGGDDGQAWLLGLENKNPIVNVLLYDHLYPDERRLEIVALNKDCTNEARHLDTSTQYKNAAAEVEQYSIEDWAERLYQVLVARRHATDTRDRHMVFICHSTGGIVVKAALSKQIDGQDNELMTKSIAVTFMAVPHHGRFSVLRLLYVVVDQGV